jgi:hypothetical protein
MMMTTTSIPEPLPVYTDGATIWVNGVETVAGGFKEIYSHSPGTREWETSLPKNPHWVPIGGLASGVGSGWVLGLGPDGNGNSGIFHWDRTAQNWPAGSGRAKTITVDLNGVPWVVTAAGQIFKWDGLVWSTFGGVGTFCATSVASGSTDSETWATRCGDNSIWKWSGSGWVQQPGAGLKVAMVSTLDPTCKDHLPIALGTDGNIYVFAHTDCNGVGFYANGAAVDVSTDLAVGFDGYVYLWNPAQSRWDYYVTAPAGWGTTTRIGGWGTGTFAFSTTSGAIQMLQ